MMNLPWLNVLLALKRSDMFLEEQYSLSRDVLVQYYLLNDSTLRSGMGLQKKKKKTSESTNSLHKNYCIGGL